MIERAEDYIGRRMDAPPERPERPTTNARGRRSHRGRRAPWTAARLFRACRSAPAVWLALCELAQERGGAAVVTPTRDELAKRAGVSRLPTISAALTALERAGWIERAHVPKFENGQRCATLLRIVLRRSARKSFPTARAP